MMRRRMNRNKTFDLANFSWKHEYKEVVSKVNRIAQSSARERLTCTARHGFHGSLEYSTSMLLAQYILPMNRPRRKIKLHAVPGIEPEPPACEPDVLPTWLRKRVAIWYRGDLYFAIFLFRFQARRETGNGSVGSLALSRSSHPSTLSRTYVGSPWLF